MLIKERFERRFSVKKKEVDSLASQDLGSRYHTLQQQSASLKLQLSEVHVHVLMGVVWGGVC